MSKYCPVYNCKVLYLDCQECENKACKHIVARKLKLRPGDIIEVKTLFGNKNKFMYIGSALKGKRVLYRFSDQKFIEVDSDFPKLKKIKKVDSDTILLHDLKWKYNNT